jgi:hypothetical protein
MIRLRDSLRRFAKDEGGVVIVEALITLPILIWGFLALIVYWDVYRTINVSQKAAYSISDLLSRQQTVTPDFIDGLDEVLAFLTPGSTSSQLRVTSFQLDEGGIDEPDFDSDDTFCLLFSTSPGGIADPLTPDDLKGVVDRIPNLENLESLILVETWVEYDPSFNTGVTSFAPGVTAQTFSEFIVTRPRNWRRVTLDGTAHACT